MGKAEVTNLARPRPSNAARKAHAPLTEKFIADIKPPASWHADGVSPNDTPQLYVRVFPSGLKSFVVRLTSGTGKRTAITIGRAGPGGMGLSQARAETVKLREKRAATGRDLVATINAEKQAEKKAHAEAITLAEAVREYVEGKVRAKDALGLKARTKADYLGMVAPATLASDTRRAARAGMLYPLANTSINEITGDDVRAIWSATKKSSPRQAAYAMQAMRAVLRWHGVQIPGNPFARDAAGKHRIVLGSTARTPTPIPPQALGKWWRAASATTGRTKLAADALRFILLTGMRPGEVLGDEFNAALKVGDIKCGRLVRHDTKNRTTLTVLLSKQAQDIVTAHAKGRRAASVLFPIRDARKTLRAINEAAGLEPDAHSPHDLRKTFGSIAEGLVSVYALKTMMNHATSGDVTATHYVRIDDAKLTAGWQAVADFIEAQS